MEGKFEWFNVSELANRPITQREVEQAYRRGYMQGFSAAMDALDGKGRDEWRRLAEFFDGPLSRWRDENHDGQILPPPQAPG